MALQLNIFLLLFGGLQGLLLSVFFIRKKIYHAAYIYLVLYLGVMLLQITLKVMSKLWLMNNWPMLYSLSYYLPLLYGPLLFLFVKHSLLNTPFRSKELCHFLPFGFLLLIAFTGVYSNLPLVIDVIFFNPHARMLLLVASICSYHFFAFRLWTRQRKKQGQDFSEAVVSQINWLKQFIAVSALVGLMVTAALYLLYINYPNGHQYRYGFVALTFCIYWFSYTALTRPSAFTVIKGHERDQAETILPIPQLKVYHPAAKYSNSSLTEEQVKTICENLGKIMEKEKLYLQPNLTIAQLAEEMNCTRHHLSQVLNDQLNKSYYDYINQLRIEAAKNLLVDPQHQQYKIASIAYEAGFNSLSTFNEVFKKFTGVTPSDYRKTPINESRQQRV
jgi:AraC-like DNA-binding protein